jgi:hypothetical protein
VPGAGGGAR